MNDALPIPAYGLYGEALGFPDVCHVETITDRAAGHDWRISPHRHEDLHQIIIIQHGLTRFQVEGQEFTLPAPIAFNLPRRTVHGFAFEAATIGHVFTVPVTEVADCLSPQSPISGVLSQAGHVTPDAGMIARMTELSQVHAGDGLARVQRLRALSADLLGLMAESLAAQRCAPAPAQSALNARFEAFVAAHLAEALTVAQIASALAISPTHLNRIIKVTTGLSVLRAVEAMRMRESCRQLAYTRRSIAEVGIAAGYPDPSYFSRAFQRHMGLSPRDYRRKLGG